MGSLAPVLISGLLGLGAAGLSYMGQRNMYKAMNNSQQSALVDMQNNNESLLDQLPEPPAPPTEDASPVDNAAAEAARQKEKQAAALAEQQNMTNPTGGLGVAGGANTNRKQLLGS